MERFLHLYLDDSDESLMVHKFFIEDERTEFYMFQDMIDESIPYIPTSIGIENGERVRIIHGYKIGWLKRLKTWLNDAKAN